MWGQERNSSHPHTKKKRVRLSLSGTVEDALRMEQAFIFLGYEVIMRQNVKKEGLISECVKLRSYDYLPANRCKRIAVVFSGHRQDGELILQDDCTMTVADLVNAFKPHSIVNTKCSSLTLVMETSLTQVSYFP